jgi:hypothetical protein
LPAQSLSAGWLLKRLPAWTNASRRRMRSVFEKEAELSVSASIMNSVLSQVLSVSRAGLSQLLTKINSV